MWNEFGGMLRFQQVHIFFSSYFTVFDGYSRLLVKSSSIDNLKLILKFFKIILSHSEITDVSEALSAVGKMSMLINKTFAIFCLDESMNLI